MIGFIGVLCVIQLAPFTSGEGYRGDKYGYSVAAMDDIDGDGVAEFAVGAPTAGRGDRHSSQWGEVLVISGKTGALLRKHTGESAAGKALYSIHDVDGDGVRDLAIGSNRSAVVVSGASGQEIREVDRRATRWIGELRLLGAGDLDGDKGDDYVVCERAFGDGNVGPTGRVMALSGRDMRRLWSAVGGRSMEFRGAIDCGRDVTGDSVPDVVVGGELRRDGRFRGKCRILSGATGEGVWTFTSSEWGDRLGHSVAFVDDCNGDNVSDVVVGAPGHGDAVGRVTILSGADGRVIRHLEEPGVEGGRLGYAVCAFEDVDDDGVGDWLVSMNMTGMSIMRGEVVLYSGATGAVIRRDRGPRHYGSALAQLGDVDEDGVSDYVAGAACVYEGETYEMGRVVVRSGANGDVLYEVMRAD